MLKVKQWIVILCILTIGYTDAFAAPQFAFRILFKDKAGAGLRTVQLTPRAMERRSRQGIVPDEYDIPVSSEYIQRVLELTDGTLHLTSRWLNSCVIWLPDSGRIASLSVLPFVSSIAYIGYQTDSVQPGRSKDASPGYKQTTGPSFYGDSWMQTALLNGNCLHEKGFTGAGKLIAVLDDGSHFVHSAPAFDSVFSSGRILDTRNFVTVSNDVYSAVLTHGTLVLSTMAANLPGIYVGAATGASYALYVTEDNASETPLELDNMVAAFERADSIGADIITASVGYNTFQPPFPPITPAEMDGKTTVAAIGANIAAQKGMLVVMTGGNEGSGGLLTPGDADSALTVGSVNASKIPAFNSGYGPNAAGHIKPEVCALGQPGYVITGSLAPFASNGTSIATPQIAGWAACLWQAGAGQSNAAVKRSILRSADLYPSPQMPQLGYGVPDFCSANTLLDVTRYSGQERFVSLSPNPFDEQLFLKINIPTGQELTVSLTDVQGKNLFYTRLTASGSEQNSRLEIPSSLVRGLYFCRITIGETVKTFKLMKQ